MDLIAIYNVFPNEDACIKHLEKIRWKGSPQCPYCQSKNISPRPKENRNHCNVCNTSFGVTVGTVFHHFRLPLQKWFLAICLILNSKKDITARKLARCLTVNKDTAWRMNMKIMRAMTQKEQRELLIGVIKCFEFNMDESSTPRKNL